MKETYVLFRSESDRSTLSFAPREIAFEACWFVRNQPSKLGRSSGLKFSN